MKRVFPMSDYDRLLKTCMEESERQIESERGGEFPSLRRTRVAVAARIG